MTGTPCSRLLIIWLAYLAPFYEAKSSSVTEQVVYEFPFPSLPGPEVPVNQIHKANRFLLPLLASIKIPEHQADYFLHYWPGRSQVPDIVTGQGSPTAAQQALSTKSSSHKS